MKKQTKRKNDISKKSDSNAGNSLKVLVLNASLKHLPEESNTEDISKLILKKMESHSKISSEIVRLADKNIPVGLNFRESDNDDWPSIADKMEKADIVIFATPIWWGSRSSLMQRVIERMDAYDEEHLKGGRDAFLNKVAGIAITGSEDGAQSVMAHLMSTLSFMNFTLPPQCTVYWVGEVGMDSSSDAKRRRKNKMTDYMAKLTAESLVYYAKLLKKYPLDWKKK